MDFDPAPFFDADYRAKQGAGLGGEGGGPCLGLVEGGDQGPVVGDLGVADEEVGPSGASRPGSDRAPTRFPAWSGWCRTTAIPSPALYRVRLPRLTLRTEMRPVVTSPGPTPGTACTAAITVRNRPDTALSAAPRVLRSTLTEKPNPAVSFGTCWVTSPLTAIVRSCATAEAGTSRAIASSGIRAWPSRRSTPRCSQTARCAPGPYAIAE